MESWGGNALFGCSLRVICLRYNLSALWLKNSVFSFHFNRVWEGEYSDITVLDGLGSVKLQQKSSYHSSSWTKAAQSWLRDMTDYMVAPDQSSLPTWWRWKEEELGSSEQTVLTAIYFRDVLTVRGDTEIKTNSLADILTFYCFHYFFWYKTANIILLSLIFDCKSYQSLTKKWLSCQIKTTCLIQQLVGMHNIIFMISVSTDMKISLKY